jgi:hypothetical protein
MIAMANASTASVAMTLATVTKMRLSNASQSDVGSAEPFLRLERRYVVSELMASVSRDRPLVAIRSRVHAATVATP